MNESSCVFQVIHETLMEDHTLSVSAMCEIAGVSRSGYYAWLKAAPVRQRREEEDRKDFELILQAYQARGYAKGAKSIHMRLLHMNPPVVMNLKKIHRLMRKYRLICPLRQPNPYRRMAKALRTNHVASNLLDREFECYGPRIVLLTDITYIPYNGMFAYLSTILDAYTKQILAYTLSDSLEVDFVLATVTALVREHGVSLHQETILHSDQGSHYTSRKFVQILEDKDLRQSMSGRGNCWDNAPRESFFGHMKDHISGKLKTCESYEQAKALIDAYMDYYNNERYQWELAKLSPNEYYQFCVTGEYPLRVPNPPPAPKADKSPKELGRHAVENPERASPEESAASAERPHRNKPTA